MTEIIDTDGDDLRDDDEINTYGTDPNSPDTDGDGINDGDEVEYWNNNPDAEWYDDPDGDGVRDPAEPGIEGWTVFLDENDNQPVDWMVTEDHPQDE